MIQYLESMIIGVNACFVVLGFCLCAVGAFCALAIFCSIISGIMGFFRRNESED